MSFEQFERALLLYGPDLERWPPDLSVAAQSLLARDDVACALLREAQLLENRIGAATQPHSLSGGAIARIHKAVDRHRGGLLLEFRRLLLPAGIALASVTVAGGFLGFQSSQLGYAENEVLSLALLGADVWLVQWQ